MGLLTRDSDKTVASEVPLTTAGSYPSAPRNTSDPFSGGYNPTGATEPGAAIDNSAPKVGQYDFSAPASYDPSRPAVVDASQPQAGVSTPGAEYKPYEATERKAPFQGAEYDPYEAKNIAAGTGSYDYTRGEVDPQSLVENRLTGLLKSDSDYMKLSDAKVLQEMNKGNLLNTSIALSAGRKGAIEAAMPIAQQDAATYGEMTQANLGYATEADRINAEKVLAVESQNVAAATEAARTGALAEQDVSKFNVGLEEAANQFYAGMETDAEKANALAMLDASKLNAGIISQEAQFNETQRAQIDQFNKQAINDAATNYSNAKNDQNFEILKGTVNAQLANIDAQLQSDLLTIEQTYLADRNMDSINGAIYQEMTRGIANIIATSDADPVTGLPKEIEVYMSSVGATYDFISPDPGMVDVADKITVPDVEELEQEKEVDRSNVVISER